MTSLEVFFDYACPYCLSGHQILLELLPDFPHVSVVWRPCESHPRPERFGMHSDLLIQGMYFAADHGANLLAYHQRAYDLILKRRADVERADVVAAGFADLLDTDALYKALTAGQYSGILQDANDYAFERSGVWVVPAYRMNGRRLDSIEDEYITKAQLEAFLDLAK